MTILLTGFTPFGDQTVNPSQRIVEALADRADITGVVLPTIYQTAGERLVALLDEHQPTALVMLGVAARRAAINLERFALNIDDASAPDNAGDLRQSQPIVPGGPAAYTSTLPIAAMQQALQTREIPVTISNHAGAYVCNHLFYVACHALDQTGSSIPCGFLHVPGLDAVPLATMIEAIAICVGVLTRETA
jgi:pyroglutamyl-peptidase